MKVVLFNGSRKDNGCTFTALNLVADALKAEGVEAEIFSVGRRIFNGEIESVVNEAAVKVREADGFVFGSPVYWASPSGELVLFMDRLWAAAGSDLRFKPAASVSTCRRAGNTATLDVINKYFAYSAMPIVTSCYWNEIHGKTPEDVLKDEEGVQTLTMLGKNMAWILKSIEAGKSSVAQPVWVDKVMTSFIR